MPKILFFPSTSQDPAQWLHPRGCPWGGARGLCPPHAALVLGPSCVRGRGRVTLQFAQLIGAAFCQQKQQARLLCGDPGTQRRGSLLLLDFIFFFPSPPCSSSELAVWVVAAARGAVQRSWHGGSAVARPGCLGCSAAVGERRRPAGTAVARSGSGASSCAGGGCAVGRRRAWSPAAGRVPSVSGRGAACPRLAGVWMCEALGWHG